MSEDVAIFHKIENKTIESIHVNREDEHRITFTFSDGEVWEMYHLQDCCEVVQIESIVGDLKHLINSPLLIAEERTRHTEDGGGSETWTFYELATVWGSVTIRWHGESNGYYSERVEFAKRGGFVQ